MNENIVYDSENINVQEIMAQIQEDAKRLEKTSSYKKLNSIQFGTNEIDNISEITQDNSSKIEQLLKSTEISPWFTITGNPFKKFIKRLIRKFILWLIDPPFSEQRNFNRLSADIVRSVYNNTSEIVQKSNERYKESNERYRESNERYQKLDDKLTYLEQDIISHIKQLNSSMGAIKSDIFSSLEMRELIAKVNVINYRLRKYKQTYNHVSELSPETDDNIYDSDYLNENLTMDYFLFEEIHRGSEEDISKRLSIYLPYFKNKSNILDIGCGRGEFLKLLKDQSVSCKGIDINEEMVEYCVSEGLDVSKHDIIKYLSSLKENSLGGIISTQVIEHLSNEDIIKTIRLSYNKLEPGSYFIAETINPQSLIVFTGPYFVDPTHQKMIHPLTIKFILESEGFKDVKILFSSEVPEHMKLLPVKAVNPDDQEHLNNSINILNGMLYGPQDYAVIGRK